MKITNLISILFCFVIISSFSSCEKEKDAMGTLQFECSVPVLKSSGSAITLTSALVSINDKKGNSIYSNQKIEILNMNGYYISKPLSIKPGDYVLSSFLLCDKNNTIVYASPLKDSPKAYLVQTPLPIDFKISKDQVSKLVPEVISATDAVPSDFGYATFSFNVVETFDLFIAAFAYEESNKDFYMTDALLTISASGKPSMNFKLENKTNTLEIPAGYGEYLLSIKKEGYKTIEKKLSELELKTYNGSSDSSVLKILLEEWSLNDGLIAYFPFDGDANNASEYNLSVNAMGGIAPSNDRFGNANRAMNFNGENGYISISHSDILNFDNVSVSVWVLPGTPKSFLNGVGKSYWQYSGIVNKKGKVVNNQNSFSTAATSSIFRTSVIFTDGAAVEPGVREAIVCNEWQHLVYVIDNGIVKLYKNNQLLLQDESKKGKVISKNTEPLLIGKTYWFPDFSLLESYFYGSMDELMIYNRALTTEEINELYNVK